MSIKNHSIHDSEFISVKNINEFQPKYVLVNLDYELKISDLTFWHL